MLLINSNDLHLIYRQKLAGPGFHYGAILLDGSCLDFSPAGIRHCTLNEFQAGNKHFVERKIPYTNDVRARLQELIVGKGVYDLLNFNCEHFARYIVEGQRKSVQVGMVLGIIGVIGAIVLLSD